LALSFGSFAYTQHYTKVNLVANTSGIAPVTDGNLVNPWGISRTSGSPWWISDNGKGLSTLYNGAGVINNRCFEEISKLTSDIEELRQGSELGIVEYDA
jgi:hypothetical protein